MVIKNSKAAKYSSSVHERERKKDAEFKQIKERENKSDLRTIITKKTFPTLTSTFHCFSKITNSDRLISIDVKVLVTRFVPPCTD